MADVGRPGICGSWRAVADEAGPRPQPIEVRIDRVLTPRMAPDWKRVSDNGPPTATTHQPAHPDRYPAPGHQPSTLPSRPDPAHPLPSPPELSTQSKISHVALFATSVNDLSLCMDHIFGRDQMLCLLRARACAIYATPRPILMLQ